MMNRYRKVTAYLTIGIIIAFVNGIFVFAAPNTSNLLLLSLCTFGETCCVIYWGFAAGKESEKD